MQLLNAGVFRRLKVCWGRLWSTPWVRLIVFTFIVIRVGLLLFAPLARMLYPGAFDPHPEIRLYLGVAPVTNLWLEPWQRWDTPHFQVIAERGYGAYDTSLFSPFLYPLLIRLVADVFGGDTLLAGLIVSNLAYLVALAYLYRLTAMETDHQVARRCILYIASFPTAFFSWLLIPSRCSYRQRWLRFTTPGKGVAGGRRMGLLRPSGPLAGCDPSCRVGFRRLARQAWCPILDCPSCDWFNIICTWCNYFPLNTSGRSLERCLGNPCLYNPAVFGVVSRFPA